MFVTGNGCFAPISASKASSISKVDKLFLLISSMTSISLIWGTWPTMANFGPSRECFTKTLDPRNWTKAKLICSWMTRSDNKTILNFIFNLKTWALKTSNSQPRARSNQHGTEQAEINSWDFFCLLRSWSSKPNKFRTTYFQIEESLDPFWSIE